MQCFQERIQFLFKFKDCLDFVLLTANKSVTDHLILQTPDLPWNLGEKGERLSVPRGYIEKQMESHAEEERNEWMYVEACCNPFWTWDTMSDSVERGMADERWKRYERWFFQNWSRNEAIMKTSKNKVVDSLRKYIAATKIKRSFKRCVSNPYHPFCKSRLLREFVSLHSNYTLSM